jgi:hypothetical protein
VSHIAAALAKSKGKKVEAPPPGSPDVPVMPLPVLPMSTRVRTPAVAVAGTTPKKLPLPYILGGGLVVLALAAFGWFWLKPVAALPPQPVAAVPKPATAAPALSPVVPPPAIAAISVAPPVGPVLAKPVVVTPSPVAESTVTALQDQIMRFSVTLRKTGADQRAVINGKTYTPGDHVTDALTLQEVLNDRIVLRDDGGNFYTK